MAEYTRLQSPRFSPATKLAQALFALDLQIKSSSDVRNRKAAKAIVIVASALLIIFTSVNVWNAKRLREVDSQDSTPAVYRNTQVAFLVLACIGFLVGFVLLGSWNSTDEKNISIAKTGIRNKELAKRLLVVHEALHSELATIAEVSTHLSSNMDIKDIEKKLNVILAAIKNLNKV